MKSDSPAVTDPAMQVIRDLDPETWQAIDGDADWEVHVLEPGDGHSDQLISDQNQDPLSYMLAIFELNNGALGVTENDATSEAARWTDLNMPAIRSVAGVMGMPVEQLTASVLVHEYVHHRANAGETEAYATEIEFARKLGSQRWLWDRIVTARPDNHIGPG